MITGIAILLLSPHLFEHLSALCKVLIDDFPIVLVIDTPQRTWH